MNTRRQWLISFVAALLVTLVIGGGAIRRLDRWMQDWFYQRPGLTSGDIVIIGIDDEAFEVLGPYNTWDRNIMASALEALAADPDNRPAVTAIDVLYAGHSFEQADDRLAEAAASLGNVVTASLAEYGEEVIWDNGRAVSLDRSAVVDYAQPYEELRKNTVQGHINAMYDADGVMRHAILYVETGEERVYSMACETARLFEKYNGRELQLPADGEQRFCYIPYSATPGNYYDGVSIARLLGGEIPSEYWAGKIVLIGPYAAALQDAYFTPIDKGSPMNGVEIQANVIQSLLERNYKKEVSGLLPLVILFLLCLVIGKLFQRMSLKNGGLLFAGLIVLSIAGAVFLYKLGFVIHPLWLPAGVAVLYLLSVITHYIRAAKERQALALEKERMEAELALASRIQLNSLPKTFPPFPERHEFDIYASMTPAKEVGGDLYDFFLIDEDHLGLVIGDVSGKGFPAALFMMVATSLIRNEAMRGTSPAHVLQTVNRQICYRNPDEMFVTVWLGVLEISTGRLTAANAGHEYPILKKTGESFALFKDRHGFVIGGMEETRYKEYEIMMTPGTKLFVYTDGVAEAANMEEELFGTERLVDLLCSGENGSPQEITDHVKQGVQAFVGDAPQADDLTILCLQYNGTDGHNG